jgi:branched-chain amino acid aminotransferase
MTVKVNVNGTLHDKEHAVISVFDHGFLYGEGVYEVLRTYNGQPFLFERHMRRLRRSAGMMALDVPLSDAVMASRIAETVRAAGLGDTGQPEAYVRLMITRGLGELSYDPGSCAEPSIIVIVKPFVGPSSEVYEKGVRVALVSVVRNHPATVNPRIKSNNLLNSALAMQEAARSGAFEGLMRNYRGELAECTQSNVFVVRNGEAITPPIDAGLLPGITREFLFEVGREVGVLVREETLKDADLFDAEEAFLTSTTRQIVPIVKVDDRPIGRGTPGVVTTRLLEAFRRKVQELTGSRQAETSRQAR